MNATTETKRNAALTATITGATLRIVFADGKTIELNTIALDTTILQHATMHGLKQKLCDAAAISRNPETGKPATVADKYEAVKAVYDRLLAGEWNARREGSGGSTLLLRALVALYPQRSPELLREWLAGMDDAKKAALRVNPRVAAEIAKLQAARAADIDSYELLSELE